MELWLQILPTDIWAESTHPALPSSKLKRLKDRTSSYWSQSSAHSHQARSQLSLTSRMLCLIRSSIPLPLTFSPKTLNGPTASQLFPKMFSETEWIELLFQMVSYHPVKLTVTSIWSQPLPRMSLRSKMFSSYPQANQASSTTLELGLILMAMDLRITLLLEVMLRLAMESSSGTSIPLAETPSQSSGKSISSPKAQM